MVIENSTFPSEEAVPKETKYRIEKLSRWFFVAEIA